LENNIYPLLYGINLDTGEENWYTYEESENTLQKFVVGGKNGSGDVKLATSVASTDKFKNLSIILGGISGILFVFLIIAGIRISMSRKNAMEEIDNEFNSDIDNDLNDKVLPIENQPNEELPNEKEENIEKKDDLIEQSKSDLTEKEDKPEETNIKEEKAENNKENNNDLENINLEKTNVNIIKSDTDNKKTEN